MHSVGFHWSYIRGRLLKIVFPSRHLFIHASMHFLRLVSSGVHFTRYACSVGSRPCPASIIHHKGSISIYSDVIDINIFRNQIQLKLKKGDWTRLCSFDPYHVIPPGGWFCSGEYLHFTFNNPLKGIQLHSLARLELTEIKVVHFPVQTWILTS